MASAPLDDNACQKLTDKILDQVGEIAVLPQVVFKVMEMTGSDNSSASELERAIVVDPGFSARLLTLANSAYFALPRKVTSLREAVVFIGFKAVRQMAMTIGVFDMFLGKTDRESLRRRSWWRRSLDAAVCGKTLAEELTPDLNADSCYTCGLLHLIGKNLLDRHNPEQYNKVEFLIAKGASDFMAENAVYGCHHMELNAAAALRWGFPEELQAGLQYGLEPAENEIGTRMRAMTSLSAAVARSAIDGAKSGEANHGVPMWALQVLEVSEDRVEYLLEQGAAAVASARHLMG